MSTSAYPIALSLAVVLASGHPLLAAGAASAQRRAISATVSGTSIQQVGFRAMIQKEAIKFNIAGMAQNNPDGTVKVSLQGDNDRIDKVLDAIRDGAKHSSKNNSISAITVPWDPDLKTFTVTGWTSVSRNITTPYNLVFSLRSANNKISSQEAKNAWNDIAKNTLKGDDLTKFIQHIDGDAD